MEKVIETPRLYLRKYTNDDFFALKKIISDPETMKYYPKPYDDCGVQRWIDWNLNNYQQYGFGLWAIILKDNNTFIGDCGITMQNINHQLLPECGFHINKNYWQKGYAKEAATAVLNYAFNKLGFDTIFCYQNSLNVPSRKTAESIGMTLKEKYFDDQKEETSVYFIKKEEYIKTLSK